MKKVVILAYNTNRDATLDALGSTKGVKIIDGSGNRFIDVEVSPGSEQVLADFCRNNGLDLENMPEAQLMDPISPFKKGPF